MCQGVKAAVGSLGAKFGRFFFGSHPSLRLFGAPGDKSCCVSSCFSSFVFCDVQIFFKV